jgi:2-polyprenyl-3-methyl-5-hydroxy-6-metoxy-1,4-benzoquinol methylase
VNLIDLIHRQAPPVPWTEGEKIPWSDPEFSARMLHEHLSQEHDAASRRSDKIDAQVAWIQRELLHEQPAKILDLCCGPGLYTSRLARLGHTCVGIDYGPASIAYAVRLKEEQGLPCIYLQEDVREARYGSGYGLAMLIFGEFNVFHPSDARQILSKAHAALAEGGVLLLEPMRADAMERLAKSGAHWQTAAAGLFSDRPHLYLEEQFWHADSRAHSTRTYIVDAATGEVQAYASTQQAYTEQDLRETLAEVGFRSVQFYPSLLGVPDASQGALFAVVARK